MDIKTLLQNKTFEVQNNSNLQNWQEYALEVVEEFGIKGQYRAIIFKHAKNNKSYLQGKVELCKEKFGHDLQDKGRYLISLFRKKKPWEK